MFSAPLFDEGLFYADIDLAEVRRERISLPLLRDERPELVAREWRRLVAERAGLADDSTAERGAADGFDVGDRRGTGPVSDGAAAPAMFVLPDELAIDTGVAQRLIAEFIRGQLRQAGFERAVLGLSGGIDSALVAYLIAEAIGAERLHCVLMPYRTSSPASQGDAEEVVRRLGCSVGAGRDHADGRRLLRGRRRAGRGRARGPRGGAAPPGQLHGPDADERPVRPVGHVARPRRRDRATRPSR